MNVSWPSGIGGILAILVIVLVAVLCITNAMQFVWLGMLLVMLALAGLL